MNNMQYCADAPVAMTMMMTRAITAIMTDQHKPIEIIDRVIKLPAADQISLVAEDNISQCLTFRMP
jgi:hypothetical protein